jgi:hypothetical protein
MGRGHTDVDDNRVDSRAVNERKKLLGVTGLADDVESSTGQKLDKAGA